MGHKHVVDTHALIWFLEGNNQLGASAKIALSSPQSELVIPTIVLAEASLVIEKGRSTISNTAQFLSTVTADQRNEIVSLTYEIIEESISPDGLKIPELHDRFIVSTGLLLQKSGHTVDIITVDKEMTAAKVLNVLW